MNVKAKSTKPLDWKRIGLIAIVLCVAGYTWYTENFKPEGGGAAVADRDENESSANDYTVNFPDTAKTSEPKKKTNSQFEPIKSNSGSSAKQFEPIKKKSSSGSTAKQFEPIKKSNSGSAPTSKSSNGSYLVSDGGRNKRSPAGLIYGMGGGGEHRTDHVLRHAEDQPNRPGTHSVFDADGDDVFRLIDEAYELIKQKSKRVKSEKSRGNMAHVIDMQRKIGFKGGQSGKRSGHKPLKKIKLILAGGNRVITAFPY